MDTINSYVYRGPKPQPLGVPPPRKIQTAGGERLSTILESGAPNPKRNSANVITQAPWERTSQYGEPPLASEEKSPPLYNAEADTLARLQSDEDDDYKPNPIKAWFSRRGGLKRLALIILAVLVVLGVALGVGLGVGLNKHSGSSSSSSSTTSPSSSSPSGPFPAGAYAVQPFLTNVSTACTSDASTWTCYPYSTYSSSPSGSEVTFDWVITQSSQSSDQFLISSSDNPLALTFTNATLTLVDANTDQERYTFSVNNLVKSVYPTGSLTNDNIRSVCYYNSTILTASLYTRMNATLTDGSGTTSSSAVMQNMAGSINYNQTWPGAVMVEQVATGGSEVPNCYRFENGVGTGDQIPLSTESTSTECSCTYTNYS